MEKGCEININRVMSMPGGMGFWDQFQGKAHALGASSRR